MKKILLILLFLFSNIVYSQTMLDAGQLYVNNVAVQQWDPLKKGTNTSISGGGLIFNIVSSGVSGTALATLPITGKKYWECKILSISTSGGATIGIGTASMNLNGTPGASDNQSWGWIGWQAASAGYGICCSFTYFSYTVYGVAGDIIGNAVDATAGTWKVYKNNSFVGTIYSSLPAYTFYPAAANYATGFISIQGYFTTATFNFTPPSGYTGW